MVIQTLSLKDCSLLNVDEREALRYLGVKEADESVLSLLQTCKNELLKLGDPRAVYALADIANDGEAVDFGFMKVESKNLAKNLEGCPQAYVFCATLGVGIDRYYERLTRVSQAKATVFSSTASSLIESFCDYLNSELAQGLVTRPRFSCGYGDFCIKHQADILNALEAGKRLGVALTDNYMMVPVKTVTAIIGIRR
jgi:hypothetical protein